LSIHLVINVAGVQQPSILRFAFFVEHFAEVIYRFRLCFRGPEVDAFFLFVFLIFVSETVDMQLVEQSWVHNGSIVRVEFNLLAVGRA